MSQSTEPERGKPSVAIVDDDAVFAEVLERSLIKSARSIRTFTDPIMALPAILETPPDILLLDIAMPILDGYEFCRRIRIDRRTAALPVIMVTGLTTLEDRLRGFEVGADDYICKPFHVKELIARILAVLRRVRGDVWGKVIAPYLEIELPSMEVRVRGRPVELTPRELDLLCILAGEPGRVFAREELIAIISRRSPGIPEDSNTIAVHVASLRRKIEEDPDDPCLILTVRGAGYKYIGPGQTTGPRTGRGAAGKPVGGVIG